MAFTRKALKAMGIEEDKIDTLVEMHTETIDALKGQIADLTTATEELSIIKADLAKAQADLESANKDGWKQKYEAEHTAHEAYKTEVANAKLLTEKQAAYKAMLAEAGLKGDKLINTILASVDFSQVEVEDSKVKGADTESIKTEWADFIPSTETKGATVETPSKQGGAKDYSKLSDDEYYALQKQK